MLLKHAVRTTYTLLFVKLVHLAHIAANILFRQSRQYNFCVIKDRTLIPRPSFAHPGHFTTYLECACLNTLQQRALDLDEGLPSLLGDADNEKICSVCKRYVFVSKAYEDRHYLLLNDRRSAKRKAAKNVSQLHVCTYKDCGKEFTTYYLLTRHKKQTGHKCQRGRKRLQV